MLLFRRSRPSEHEAPKRAWTGQEPIACITMRLMREYLQRQIYARVCKIHFPNITQSSLNLPEGILARFLQLH